jgi:hypothetical protein
MLYPPASGKGLLKGRAQDRESESSIVPSQNVDVNHVIVGYLIRSPGRVRRRQGSRNPGTLSAPVWSRGRSLIFSFSQWLGSSARRVSVASRPSLHAARDESVVPSVTASAPNSCCLIAGGSGLYKKAAPSPEFLEAFSRKLAGLFHLRFQHHPVVAFAITLSASHLHLHLHLSIPTPSPSSPVSRASSASEVRSAQTHSFVHLL